jgi:hypothetical protein
MGIPRQGLVIQTYAQGLARTCGLVRHTFLTLDVSSPDNSDSSFRHDYDHALHLGAYYGFALFYFSHVNCYGARGVGFQSVLGGPVLQHSTGRCPSLDSSFWRPPFSFYSYHSTLSDKGGRLLCVPYEFNSCTAQYPMSHYYITMIPIPPFPRFTFGRLKRLMKTMDSLVLHSSPRQCFP